jgi:hypothetical protein
MFKTSEETERQARNVNIARVIRGISNVLFASTAGLAIATFAHDTKEPLGSIDLSVIPVIEVDIPYDEARLLEGIGIIGLALTGYQLREVAKELAEDRP